MSKQPSLARCIKPLLRSQCVTRSFFRCSRYGIARMPALFRFYWLLKIFSCANELKMLPFPPRATRKDYFEQNVLGTVPLLVDGTTKMTESAAIPHYLAMKHADGRMTLPVDHDEYGA